MRNAKTIKFYRKSNYGRELEYIHPDNQADGEILLRLTGKRTVDSVTRELIRDLTGSMVTFSEVIAP